ncbi:MAG: hypothetical protein LC118_06310 [Dehalococcoidia bacterium]|nr:hypothetical protein [Dehalococcoidia bacterium]
MHEGRGAARDERPSDEAKALRVQRAAGRTVERGRHALTCDARMTRVTTRRAQAVAGRHADVVDDRHDRGCTRLVHARHQDLLRGLLGRGAALAEQRADGASDGLAER